MTFFPCAILLSITLDASSVIGQWAQWGGPHRNFQAEPARLRLYWPEEGPVEIWSRGLGDGYSAISVSDGKLYTTYRRGDDEVVVALDTASGKTVWEYPYSAPVWNEFEGFQEKYGPGPVATPLIHGNFVYSVGAMTDFVCLGKNTGKKFWEHNLWKDYDAPPPKRGYTSSPVVYGNTIIVPTVAKGRGVMAFDLKTGDLVWQNSDLKNRFSSPIIADVDGQDQLIVFVADYIAGLNPDNGEVLWRHQHSTQWSVHAMTPLWGDDNILFVSSAYDAGSRALRLRQRGGETSVRELWFNAKVRVLHSNAVRHGSSILASNGDFGPGLLNLIDAATGKIIDQRRGFAKANLLMSGNRLIILDEDGNLGIAIVGSSGLYIKSSAPVLTAMSWTVPTLVGTTLYLRDRHVIKALDLAENPTPAGHD